jgi:predicted DNA-binding protein
MPRTFIPVEQKRVHSTRQITISLSEEHYKKLKYLKAKTNVSMKRYIEVWVSKGIDEEVGEYSAAMHLMEERVNALRKEFGDG